MIFEAAQPSRLEALPNVRAGEPDKKGEARAEFLKRGGTSAGARNVVRMLAETEVRQRQAAESKRLKQAQQQQQQQQRRQPWTRPAVPPSAVPPPQWAAAEYPQEQRPPQRAAMPPPPLPRADEDDADDDAGLELDFTGAQAAPFKHTWQGMARGAGAAGGATASAGGAAPSARVASGFFGLDGGDARATDELEKHIGVVVAGRDRL